MSSAMLGELLLVFRKISELRANFLKHSQNSHFHYNDPALILSTTVHWAYLSHTHPNDNKCYVYVSFNCKLCKTNKYLLLLGLGNVHSSIQVIYDFIHCKYLLYRICANVWLDFSKSKVSYRSGQFLSS